MERCERRAKGVALRRAGGCRSRTADRHGDLARSGRSADRCWSAVSARGAAVPVALSVRREADSAAGSPAARASDPAGDIRRGAVRGTGGAQVLPLALHLPRTLLLLARKVDELVLEFEIAVKPIRAERAFHDRRFDRAPRFVAMTAIGEVASLGKRLDVVKRFANRLGGVPQLKLTHPRC